MNRAGCLAIVFFSACIPGGGGGDDHSIKDPPADSGTPTTGTISVKVQDLAANTAVGAANAPVVIGDALLMTGSDGTAMGTSTGPTSVTTMQTVNGRLVVETVLDAMPGDVLALGAPAPDMTDAGTFMVSFAAVPTADDYLVVSPCTNPTQQTSPIAVSMKHYCEHDPIDLVLFPHGNTDLGVSYVAAPYSRGGSATMPAPQAQTTFTAALANVPAGLYSLDWATEIVVAHNGVSMLSPPSGDLTLTDQDLLTPITNFAVALSRPNGSYQYVQARGAGTTNWSLDFSTALMPWIGHPTYDPATKALLVPSDGMGTPDLVEVIALFKNAAGTDVEWHLFASSVKDIVLPSIPTSVADVVPDLTRGAVSVQATASDLDNVDGFSQARLRPDAFVPVLTRDGAEIRAAQSLSAGH